MCSSRIWTLVAGIFGLLQAITWLGLGITALVLYHCELRLPELENSNVNPRSLSTLIYFVYFYNPKCALSLNETESWWPTEPVPTAELTWQWAVAYTIISGTWVFASVALLVNGVVWCRGACTRLIPGFWLLVTLAVIICDAVASIQYGIDIGEVTSASSLMGLLKDVIVPGSDMEKLLKSIPLSLSILPSLAILLATSKFFILWAINLILWFGIAVSLCCSGQHKHKKNKPEIQHHNPPRDYNETNERNYHVPRVNQVGRDSPNASATSTVRQDEFSWQGGPQHNMAFIGYDEAYDNDPGPVNYRRSYASDEGRNNGGRNSRLSLTPAELRNQMPWSYLHPDEPRPLSSHRNSSIQDSPRQYRSSESPRVSRQNKRPTTPLAEEWEPYSSESMIHLPRVPFHSSAPSLQHFQPQQYHFPYAPVHEQIYPRFNDVKDIYRP